MTEEQKKKAEETAQAEAEAKAKENADAGTEEESEEEGSDNDNKIDYEAELAKERSAREKAEQALAEKRFNSSKKKREEEHDVEDDTEEEKPLTASDLQSILIRERQATQKEFQRTRAEEIAKTYAKSDGERNLILEIHKNRTFPAHLSLEDQIEESFLIANRKRIIGENNELKRALRSKDGVNRDATGTYHEPMRSPAPKLSEADRASYDKAGFKYDSKDKLWKKKLGNNKFLIKNPVTKQIYMQ